MENLSVKCDLIKTQIDARKLSGIGWKMLSVIKWDWGPHKSASFEMAILKYCAYCYIYHYNSI